MPKTDRRDEIGQLINTYASFRDIVIQADMGRARAREHEEVIVSEQARSEAEKAQLQAQKTEALRALIERVESETKYTVNVVVQNMQGMQSETSEMISTSYRLGETSSASASIATQAMERTRSALESARDLSRSIHPVADRMQDARTVTQHAVVAADTARASISRLAKTVTEINEVTAVITHIAPQTGLLALNAGVEASCRRSGPRLCDLCPRAEVPRRKDLWRRHSDWRADLAGSWINGWHRGGCR